MYGDEKANCPFDTLFVFKNVHDKKVKFYCRFLGKLINKLTKIHKNSEETDFLFYEKEK